MGSSLGPLSYLSEKWLMGTQGAYLQVYRFCIPNPATGEELMFLKLPSQPRRL